MNKNLKVFFYNSYILVDLNVFCPRYETEQLVDLMKDYGNFWIKNKQIKVLEIGTGSGAMSVAWGKMFPKHNLSATDIKRNSLECAQKNLNKEKVKCNLILSNLFENITEKYDLIFANLPYVPKTFPLSIKTKKYNPATALLGGTDGLKWLRLFLQQVSQYLKSQFLIGLEIGFNQKKEIQKMIKQFMPRNHFYFQKDYSGHDRFVFIYDRRN